MYHHAYLLLGSNMDEPINQLETARKWASARAGDLIHTSALYKTAAWGNTEQPDFINQVILIRTALTPQELLNTLLLIETDMGRIRAEKYGPRRIDIDILLYDDITLNTPTLTIPHPQLPSRRFTLLPLGEIAPTLCHPVSGLTIQTLIDQCTDPLFVEKL
jgi:2-amino-4-hydroxy-6-hydroxymethyldihydropteridine diphosphokinase